MGKTTEDSRNMAEFCETTPPQIKLTKTTDKKGVNLDTDDASEGNFLKTT